VAQRRQRPVQAWLLSAADPVHEQRDIDIGAGALNWLVKAVGNFCVLGSDDLYCKNSGSGAAKILTLDGREFRPAVE
jgi:hypothetical protein